jgi:hypothetical protein
VIAVAVRVQYFNMAGAPDSVALLLFFVFWYVGNAF